MPEGLCNAVATWQRFMNWVLLEYIGKFYVVYLDNILIFSNSLEEHNRNIRLILETLRQHRLVVPKSESQLFADRIEFLGHYVSSKGIEADPTKPDKITEYQSWHSVGPIPEPDRTDKLHVSVGSVL